MKEDFEREDIDTTPELAMDDIKKRAVRGIVVLTGRGFLLNAISAIAQSLLWAYLGQYELGVFAIVQAAVGFLSYFSDLGLGAALIQKKEAPTEKDLRTTFTIQLVIVGLALAIFLILAPGLASRSNFSDEARVLMYAFAFSFFISSFRGIPTVLLERKLDFVKYSIPSLLDTLIYNVVLVVLAARGMGIASYTYAVVIRSVVGTAAVYGLEPWIPRLSFSFASLKNLLRFGLPYQLNGLVAVLKDQGIIIFLGGIIQPAGVGLLDTSQRMINLPFRFFMDQVGKVTFPAFARMQDNHDHLKTSVTRALFFVSLLTFPIVGGFVVASPIVFQAIPQYTKWLPAVPLLPFLAINAYFATVSTPLYNLLYAIGKVRQTMYLMIMWTALTWLLVPIFATRFGVQGVAVAMAIIGASSVVGILIARKYVAFSLWSSFGKPLFASIIMIVILLVARMFVSPTLSGLGILVAIGIGAYTAAIVALVGMTLIDDAKRSLKIVFNK